MSDEISTTLGWPVEAQTHHRRVSDKLMGKPIIQIPPLKPTEVILVDFSPDERERYQKVWGALVSIREQDKDSRTGKKGDIIRLLSGLRFFTSHAALIEPNFLSSQTAGNQERGSELAPAMNHCFCRVCRRVLVEPQIGNVRYPLRPYAFFAIEYGY